MSVYSSRNCIKGSMLINQCHHTAAETKGENVVMFCLSQGIQGQIQELLMGGGSIIRTGSANLGARGGGQRESIIEAISANCMAWGLGGGVNGVGGVSRIFSVK